MKSLCGFNPVMRTEEERAMTVYHFAAGIEKDEDGVLCVLSGASRKLYELCYLRRIP